MIRTVSNVERRARLGVRHQLATAATDPLAAANSVVCLHGTEASSIYLSAHARSGATRNEIDDALYRARSIVRQLAMRRTVFAFPRDLLPAAWGSAAARTANQQRDQLARGVEAAGVAVDGQAWVREACEAALAELRRAPATTSELRSRVPALAERWSPPERGSSTPGVPVASHVLTVLAASGEAIRGDNTGTWMVSRPRWSTACSWLGHGVHVEPEAVGYATLVRRWLWAFGPGTETDLAWWLGATKRAVRRALTDVDASPVALEDGSPAWLLPDDLDKVTTPEPWAALLPTLDPTTMGWRHRSFYLDATTGAEIYDRAGNARPTAWWNGKVVGTWAQRLDSTVVVSPTTSLPNTATNKLRDTADQLTAWLGGDVIRNSLQQPLVEGR